jgi:predicted phage-related endonuclease
MTANHAPQSTPDTPPVPLDGITQWTDLYDQACARIAEYEEIKKLARKEIEQALGAAEVGTIGGRPVFHWTYVTSHRLDQAKLTADHPELVEEYRRPTMSRRFTRVEL